MSSFNDHQEAIAIAQEHHERKMASAEAPSNAIYSHLMKVAGSHFDAGDISKGEAILNALLATMGEMRNIRARNFDADREARNIMADWDD